MSKTLKVLITILVIVVLGVAGLYIYLRNSKSSADVIQNSLSYFSNHHHDNGTGSGSDHSAHHVASARIYGVVSTAATSSTSATVIPNIEIVIRPNFVTNQAPYITKSGIDGAYSLSLPAGNYNITANDNTSANYNKTYETYILKSVEVDYLPVNQNIQLKPVVVNLIKNGNFELGDTLWSKYVATPLFFLSKGSIAIISSAQCYLNTGKCLAMTKKSSSSIYAYQKISGLEANKTYKFTVKFKTMGSGGTPQALVKFYNATTKQYFGNASAPATNGQWKDLNSQFTTTAANAGNDWRVYLYGNYVQSGTLYLDNASLVKTN